MRKGIIWAFAGLLTLASCQKKVKETNNLQEEFPAPAGGGGGGATVVDKLKSLAQAFLSDARLSSNFKKAIYNECLKEKYDDTYIPVRDLIAMNDTLLLWNTTRKQYIQGLVDEILAFGQNQPVVFIPFVEDKPASWIINNEYPTGVPDAVIKDEYNSSTQKCPGYTLDQSDNLVAKGLDIDEAYAWANDLWLFGAEEGVPINDTTIGHSLNLDETGYTSRVNGQAEFGGIIQVTDFSYIEPWVDGRPEFRFVVSNSSGAIIKDKEFPKRKRKDFKSPKWYDFNEFIAYWNISNIGNWMIEGWIEQDCRGGTCNNETVSQTFPAPCSGCPSTTISYQKKRTDYDMGRTIIQFTDPIATTYGISYSNIKRKN